MNGQTLLIDVVNSKFAEIRARNPHFGIHTLSKRLDIEDSALGRLLSGRHQVCRTIAEKICERLLLDPRLLPKAKTLIRQFQDDLADLVTSSPGTEVFRLCVQMIPLTKPRPPQEASK
jgi:hypothetical protein